MRVRPSLLLLLAVGCAAPRAGSTDPKAGSAAEPAQSAMKFQYPETKVSDVVETIHGVEVHDPYRWLEDAGNDDVQQWMTDQDALARSHLDALPNREQLRKRFDQLMRIDFVSAPFHRGGRYFFVRQTKKQEKAVLLYKDSKDGPEKVLIDPNTLSDDGSVSLAGYVPSWDGKLLAYRLSKNAADNATLYVRDIDSGKDREIDTIEGARYASPSWTPDSKGFYYVALPTDDKIPAPEMPGHASIKFHKLGTKPSKDKVIHEPLMDPTRFLRTSLSRDGRYLFTYISQWSKTHVYFKDLRKRSRGKVETLAGAEPKTVAAGFRPLAVGDAHYSVYPWRDQFYMTTDEGAPRSRVFKIDPKKPERSKWREIVPETKATLQYAAVIGERLLLAYLRNASTEIELRDFEGKKIRKVELPGIGSAGIQGNPDEDEAYIYYSSFTQPLQIFSTSIDTGKTDLWAEIEIPVDTSEMTVDQVWYRSKDRTQISMFIIHRKDVKLDGDNPTMLTGYGGFNVSRTPGFNASAVAWLERGGVWAIPNLRGGGEYGEQWHEAGKLHNKQNVFDDFAAAAQYLIDKRYTSPKRLAIYGGSNGGLLVGAAMVQRPDLYRAVVCAVPLLDMIRYETAGAGPTWVGEYGSVKKPKEFKTLFSYSPYHHIEQGTKYPAVLMLTADSDDRVDPMHARKFAAGIQAASTSELPTLLRIERNAGHGGGDMVSKQIDKSVDTYSFLIDQLGME